MSGSQSGDGDDAKDKTAAPTRTQHELLTQRSSAKRAVTCHINHLRQLLAELDGLKSIQDARSKLKESFEEFQDKHEEYVNSLYQDGAADDDPEIIKCEEYFAERQLAYTEVLRESNVALGLTPLSLRAVTAPQQLSAAAPPWHPPSATMYPATQLSGASTLTTSSMLATSSAAQLPGAPTLATSPAPQQSTAAMHHPAGQHGMSFHPPNMHPSTNHVSGVSRIPGSV